MGFIPSAGLPLLSTQACPWAALPLATTLTLKDAAHGTQIKKLGRDYVDLNIKEGSAAQSIITAPLYEGDHVHRSPSLGEKIL